ncbi:Ubiquitin carboxyl-terminal hydrolase CYLD, partial [Orchesella cincta]
MFYRTSIFDRLVTSKLEESEYAKTTRDLLAKYIVQPLRTEFYCSSERAMKLRSHLRTLNQDIMGSFMDVEQLLYLLVEDALKEQEFIRYSGGGGDYMHLMSIDISDNSSMITVQNNFETSMELNGNLKLKNVPNPGLILGLPRSDGKFVNYEAVIPNTELNIQHLMEPATCETCSQPASWEIIKKENAEVLQTSCDKCLDCVLREKDDTSIVMSRAKMRLLAIICISASHFTAFIRDSMGSGEWLYFDSMAGGYP